MASVFEKLWRLGPAAFVLKAIIAAVIADAALLAFILVRRSYRKRYFRRRDGRVFELRRRWDDLVSGKIPYETWRRNNFDRRIVETIALDSFEAAGPEESARLLKFLRASGLIEKRIFEARRFRGWRRLRALVALGRTRAPEGIPALAEALLDNDPETRMAALRGLGRTASPLAGQEILTWIGEKGLCVPDLPLQSALVQCCAERPALLLSYLKSAQGPLREVLARVLGEIASPSLGLELVQFADDRVDELRAASARALSRSQSSLAIDVLSELAHDRTWFVRLRAMVSLGRMSDSRAIPPLLHGLVDSNRLVRLRAAEGLVAATGVSVAVFRSVVAAHDRYGLHAYLAALENADLAHKLREALECDRQLPADEKTMLLAALESGYLTENPLKAGVQETAVLA
jgi:HEAT repeat protein